MSGGSDRRGVTLLSVRRWGLVVWVIVCSALYARTVLDARAPGWLEALRRLGP